MAGPCHQSQVQAQSLSHPHRLALQCHNASKEKHIHLLSFSSTGEEALGVIEYENIPRTGFRICDEGYSVTEAHRHVQESLPVRPWGRAWAGHAWACHARQEELPGCRRAWRGARRAAGARGCPQLPHPGPCLLRRASRAGPALVLVRHETAPLCNGTPVQHHCMSASHHIS